MPGANLNFNLFILQNSCEIFTQQFVIYTCIYLASEELCRSEQLRTIVLKSEQLRKIGANQRGEVSTKLKKMEVQSVARGGSMFYVSWRILDVPSAERNSGRCMKSRYVELIPLKLHLATGEERPRAGCSNDLLP